MDRNAEIDALRAALQRVVSAYEDTNVEFGWKARADAIDAARAELEGGK